MEIRTKIFIGVVIVLYLFAGISYYKNIGKKNVEKESLDKIVSGQVDSLELYSTNSHITKKYYIGVNMIYISITCKEKFKSADTMFNVVNVDGETIYYTHDISSAKIRSILELLSKKDSTTKMIN